jgi:hypothetical protein
MHNWKDISGSISKKLYQIKGQINTHYKWKTELYVIEGAIMRRRYIPRQLLGFLGAFNKKNALQKLTPEYFFWDWKVYFHGQQNFSY